MTTIHISMSLRARLRRRLDSMLFRLRHRIALWKWERRFPCDVKEPF